MTFGKRLVQLRKEKGFTRESFAEYLEISKYTLRNYEMDTNEPNSFLLKKLSEIFNVSIDYLLCMTDEREKTRQYTLKSSEYEHIKKYRVLDDHGKEIVDFVLDKESDRCESEYMELVARGGKYKVKKADVIELASRINSEPYKEDHDLC